MLRQLALIGCIAFTLYLLWADLRKSGRSSKALWIPLIWMFFAGTREFSQWLHLETGQIGIDAYREGNPFDLQVQLFLILAGVGILFRRQRNWGEFFARNRWIWLFFLFGGMSICWSDYPFMSFKRLIKAMGNVVMALVILTEKRPYEAVGDVLRRLAILVIPLSVILCKYYPEFGRGTHHDNYTYVGMAMGKNGLGQLCLISGLYFLWNLFQGSRGEIRVGGHPYRLMSYLFLGMIALLLGLANSATSLSCLVVALCLFWGSRIPWVYRQPQRILTAGVIVAVVVLVLETTFHIQGLVLSLLHRSPDLTTRVPMWVELLSMQRNPVVGFGYESFWMGEWMNPLRNKYPFIQSHNGYLEVYLNLGIIGLSIIVATILSGLLKVKKHLATDYPSAIMRLSIIVTVAFYNWTEATFYGVSNLWLLLFFGVTDLSGQHKLERQEVGAEE